MKKAKKLTAVLLSLVMVLALAVPAFAAENYSITITPTSDKHTYEAYQIFKGDVSDSAPEVPGMSEYVLSNIQWGSGVADSTGLVNALQEEPEFAALADGASAADVAALLTNASALETFLSVLNNGYLSGTVAGSATPGTGETSCTINLTEAGYYMVKDNDDRLEGTTETATDYIVQVLGTETMKPKSSDIPTVEKKVFEDDKDYTSQEYGEGYSDVADYEIGETVPFKLIGSIPDMSAYNTYEYIFHDTMSAGLTFDSGSVQVYLSGDKIDLTTQVTTGYTVNTNGIPEGETFTVSFTDLKEVVEGNDSDAKYVIVTYNATLNENANIGTVASFSDKGDGNPNEVYLEFSNNPNGEGTGKTEDDYAIVFTWKLNVEKIDGATEEELAGAKFVLLNEEKTQVAILRNVAGELKVSRWVDIPGDSLATIKVEDWEALTKTISEGVKEQAVVVSQAGVNFGIGGLDDDVYFLYEIEAPEGYNRVAEPIEMDIQSTLAYGTVYTGDNSKYMLTKLELYVNDMLQTCSFADQGVVNCTIENNKGSTLPETGGMGTTLFYIIGGLLVVGAGILLVVRIRMKAHNE